MKVATYVTHPGLGTPSAGTPPNDDSQIALLTLYHSHDARETRVLL